MTDETPVQTFEDRYVTLEAEALRLVSSLGLCRLPIDGLKRTPNTRPTVTAARKALESQIQLSMKLLELLPCVPEVVEARDAQDTSPLSIGERWFLRQATRDGRGVVSIDYAAIQGGDSHVRRLQRKGLGLTLNKPDSRLFILNGDGIAALARLTGLRVA